VEKPTWPERRRTVDPADVLGDSVAFHTIR